DTDNGIKRVCAVQAPIAGKIPKLGVRFPREYRARLAARGAASGQEKVVQAPIAGKIPKLGVRFPREYRARLAARGAASGQEKAEARRDGHDELLDRADQRGAAGNVETRRHFDD